jgi:hypothetical protein
MRYLIALLLGCSLFAQDENLASQKPEVARGAFYVDGIVYQYAAGRNYTVVAAAHSVINRKFVAIKLRVYNAGQHSITVKPEDVAVEDAIAGHAVTAVSGAGLANKMRKPYNMARFGVSTVAGGDQEPTSTSDMVTPQMLEMMRAMAARANGGTMPAESAFSIPTLRERWSRETRHRARRNAIKCVAFAFAKTKARIR